MVCEEHWLGGLDMRRAGQDGLTVALGESDERLFEPEQRRVERIDRAPRPEPQVRRDLIVARAAGVELAGQRTGLRRERRLDVHVDVLERLVPVEPALRDVRGE